MELYLRYSDDQKKKSDLADGYEEYQKYQKSSQVGRLGGLIS